MGQGREVRSHEYVNHPYGDGWMEVPRQPVREMRPDLKDIIEEMG